MTQLALMIDMERCIGCKSCEAACKSEHALGPGQYRNKVIWLGSAEAPVLDFFTLSCQHCERPACLRACPVHPKAIEKDPETGVVKVNESRCTGCGECVIACPYGAMGYDAADHHAVKCDLCSERRDAGLKPACATVCPGEAITFGERAGHVEKAKMDGRTFVDHDAFLLGPSNIFLERIARDEAAAPSGFTMEGRMRPSVIDGASKYAPYKPEDVVFPYGASREDRIPDEIVPGGCNICFNCCPTHYHIKDRKVIRVTGNEDDPLWKGKICPKSQFLVQLHNSTNRLTQPLKRIGARGEGKFISISWFQALEEISAKLATVRDTYGPEALGIFAGARTGTLTRHGYIRLFTQMWGTPNFADTETFCSESRRVSFQSTQGFAGSGNSYTEDDLGSASLYVYFGDNQAESRPVHFGMINNWRLKNNAQMIVLDPRLTVTASKADKWYPIRGGTDLTMALALSYHILKQEMHDQKFCHDWVEGWETWRDFLFEKEYSPEWAAEITGISADHIRLLAQKIAVADGCVIFTARGVNQHTNGTQTNRALIFLAAITGNMGRRGGAFFNFGSPVAIGAQTPEHRRHVPQKPQIGKNPTRWLEAMLGEDPYPMRALITSNNPMSSFPNQVHVREAFKSLDLLVHIELFKNETSAYADYILPAATGVEKGEIGRSSEDRRIIWIDKVADPPGDARPDGWIWIELGKRFGFDDVLKEEYKDAAVFWDEMCLCDPSVRGITQRKLHSVPWRWVRAPLYHEDDEEIDTLFLEGTTAHGHPEGHRFPTPSGKLEFYTETLEKTFKSLGLSALPEFYTDREHLVDAPYVTRRSGGSQVEMPFAKERAYTDAFEIVAPNDGSPSRKLRSQGYDTQLVTGRAAAPHFHSWTHYSWQAQEMWPDLYVQMHPAKAALLGVEDGAVVHVETAHGAINGRAWVHAGIREDTIFIPIGWDASQPFHPWPSVNHLTDDSQRDPVSDHSNLKLFMCRVSVQP